MAKSIPPYLIETLSARNADGEPHLVGLWAGWVMGLSGRALRHYVRELRRWESYGASQEEIARRIGRDFAARGIEVPQAGLRRRIRVMLLTGARCLTVH